MLEFEYARSAYKNGLKLEQQLGVNPYKFGLVSGSDAHTGLTAMEEDNFFGKTTPQEPSPERMRATFIKNAKTGVTVMDWEVGASGYAAVWANENTREAHLGCDAAQGDLLDHRPAHGRALLRRLGLREGGRRTPRSPAVAGYAKGVPDGRRSDARRPAGKAPTFLVAALRDPIGANLDRIQIVKGWLDAKGDLHEKVYDVVWGGDRKPGAGRQAAVRSAARWTWPTRPGPTPSARPS